MEAYLMKRAAIFLLAITLIATIGSANDVSTFVNLGFSPDSQAFSFGFYGVKAQDNIPHAELYVVNLEKNSFVPQGQFERKSTSPIGLGQDGMGTLLRLLNDAKPVLEKQSIDHEKTGRLVYVLLNGDEPKESLEFKDFVSNIAWRVQLKQEVKAQGAAFSILLTMQAAEGPIRTLSLGNPTLFRNDAASYRIRQIILSPDEKALVFVIEKIAPKDSGFFSTWMIETLSLKTR